MGDTLTKRTCAAIAMLVTCTIFLAACATSTGVFPSGKDTYSVVITGGVSFAVMGNLTKHAYEEAGAFCAARGKVLQPIATSSDAGGGGAMPYYELRFRALDPDDPEYGRPTLQAVPDTTIEGGHAESFIATVCARRSFWRSWSSTAAELTSR
jgi:predicted small secreted protein